MTYAELIAQAIDAAGLSQKEVADRLQLSETTVSNWVRGKRPPTLEYINSVCALLGISADSLLRAIGIELHPPAAARLPKDLLQDALSMNPEGLRLLSVVANSLRQTYPR